ncbi:MAG: Stp1/IreP family PP2C-type Ser/Thr phosphatase [Ilumatobacteraceae bacterium]
MITVTFGAVSDTGRLRNANEDSFLVSDHLLAVADGMGGHNAGEVASAMAVQLLHEATNQQIESPESFIELISNINDAIFAAATGASEQRGMGTTLTAIAVAGSTSVDERMVVINVGDSRTYILRKDELRQVTIDHSYVQELVTEGVISADDARTHPRRNIVTRALGIDSRVIADSWTLPIVDRDRYLLCSDGLVDEISNEEILAILIQNTDPQRAAESLLAAANDRGGRDNVTVIVVDVRTSEESVTASVDDTQFSALQVMAPDLQSSAASTPASRGVSKLLIPFIILVAISLAIVAGAQISQRGYFVGFNDQSQDAQVVIYKGSPQHFLWYGPTTTSTSDITRRQLFPALVREVEANPKFDSFDDARTFVDALRKSQARNGG